MRLDSTPRPPAGDTRCGESSGMPGDGVLGRRVILALRQPMWPTSTDVWPAERHALSRVPVGFAASFEKADRPRGRRTRRR